MIFPTATVLPLSNVLLILFLSASLANAFEKVAETPGTAKDKRGGGGMVQGDSWGMQIKILAIFPFLILYDGSQLDFQFLIIISFSLLKNLFKIFYFS